MPQILPAILTRPVRNKVCVFPADDDCSLTKSDINKSLSKNQFSFNNLFHKPYIKRLSGTKKYNAIRRLYLKFKKKNIILTDENPGYYIYNIIKDNNIEFTGIIGKGKHTDYINKKIIKIEKSNEEFVEEKYHLLNNIGFVSKPITLVHDEIASINAIIEKYKSKIPLYEFTSRNGYIHEVWKIIDPDDTKLIENAYAEEIEKLYIVDDDNYFDALHQIYKKKLKISKDTHTGWESYNYFPVFLVNHNNIKIHEYKKGIPPDYPNDTDKVLSLLLKDFEIIEISDYNEPQKGEILLYTPKGKFKLIAKPHILKLHLPDNTIFERFILSNLSTNEQVLKINALKYCSGKRSTKCVENQLSKGNCKFGFIIINLSFEDIKTADEKNIKIPYKSVYIEPRVLKGLFMYEI